MPARDHDQLLDRLRARATASARRTTVKPTRFAQSVRTAGEMLAQRVRQSQAQQAREARASIAAKRPEERRAMGRPDVGWARIVWGGIGLDDDDEPHGV